MLERGALAAMGTRFEIIVAGESGSHARASIEAALGEIEHCHKLWNPFSGDSMVARLHDPMREVVPIDGLTLELLSLCERLKQETGGAFSATVGSVLASRDPRREFHEGAEIPEGRSAYEIHDQPPCVRILHRDVRWDFGAIAKGFALDLAVEVLRESGVENAFLHGGSSSVTVLGSAPGLTGWDVQLPHGEVVSLQDGQSLGVSSDGGNYQGDHLIDPVGGEWVESQSMGCWVRGRSGAEVDAWATALLVSRNHSRIPMIPGAEGKDWGFFEQPRSDTQSKAVTAEVEVPSSGAESPRDCGFKTEF
ncbi:MAG: FAD:protein FMN transferase [Planctomycetota bacterium]